MNSISRQSLISIGLTGNSPPPFATERDFQTEILTSGIFRNCKTWISSYWHNLILNDNYQYCMSISCFTSGHCLYVSHIFFLWTLYEMIFCIACGLSISIVSQVAIVCTCHISSSSKLYNNDNSSISISFHKWPLSVCVTYEWMDDCLKAHQHTKAT